MDNNTNISYKYNSNNRTKDSSLFFSKEECETAAVSLDDSGYCPRCIVRFLGEYRPHVYHNISEEFQSIIGSNSFDKQDKINETPCPACLGILQKFTDEKFLHEISRNVKDSAHQFVEYQCSVLLPVSLIIRQRATIVHLRNQFGASYPGTEDNVPSVKDVWKWSCGSNLSHLLGANFQSRGQFDILLDFNYPNSENDCTFLLSAFPDTFRNRKQRKFGYETFTRASVQKALSDMSDSKFENHSMCPPRIPTAECTCKISFSHDSVFIAGRYLKYSRELSQTPWLISGKRMMEGSVQELICKPVLDMFQPTDHKLSSSGREDVDVRMLGIGRPFVVEIINPHCVLFRPEDIKQLQQRINESSDSVQVRDLQIVSRLDTSKLKEGEIDKTKSYCATCWCEKELEEEDIQKLNSTPKLVIQQKTPMRVLHRRTLLTRERTIHTMKAEKLGGNRFKLWLSTQAGTYIKEFVHGDFGRTNANLSKLLGAECDITDLDVESVDVDWPPILDSMPRKSTEESKM